MLLSSCSERNPIGRRTESNRTADGNRSDGGRKPIGRRTESDQTADGNRSDGGRNPIRRRTETDRTADGNGRGCSCLSCTNKANWQSIAAVSARLCRLPEQELHQPSQQNNLLSSNSFHSDLQQIIRVRKNKTRIYRIKRTLLPVAEVSGLRSNLRYHDYPT